MRIRSLSILAAALCLITIHGAEAAKPGKTKKPAAGIESVCPKVREIAGDVFYKNNKPIRASSAFAAPVIGYNRVMTFAYQAGRRGPLGGSAQLFDKAGNKITTFRSYPCRADHCGGRVVSSMMTATARSIAVKNTRSPEGYLQLNSNLCVHIKDIGACYNVQVRGPCAGIVK